MGFLVQLLKWILIAVSLCGSSGTIVLLGILKLRKNLLFNQVTFECKNLG